MAKRVTKKAGGTGGAGKGAKSAKVGKVTGRKGMGAGSGADAPFEVDGIDGGDEGLVGSLGGSSGKKGDYELVIVESPAKAKTINKYLGPGFKVLASVGHVRDLPSKNPKGVKSPVPGVDLERDFAPTYLVMEKKDKVISELKRTARLAKDVYFATDPDREGEAIAWHLSQELGIKENVAKRVMFNAITKDEVRKAFAAPKQIDMDRVNAQQARRILDRIVGYQVSPFLWKKVARGLSAGRVQSVAVRVVVEREREIAAFVPTERYEVFGNFTPAMAEAAGLGKEWKAQLARRDEKGNGLSQKLLQNWLNDRGAVRGELVSVDGQKFSIDGGEAGKPVSGDELAKRATEIAGKAGLTQIDVQVSKDPSGKGPAEFVRQISGQIDARAKYSITSIESKRTSSRPAPPFITSTLQQAASNRLGFGAQRTMSAAQQLYQGVEIPGEGPVALITYMRTDSTRLSGEAIAMAREYIPKAFGEKYLPEKPNFFGSPNKDAQDAHEAIRPTSMMYPPNAKLRAALKPDLFRLYQIIWERFVACQMVAAEWESISAMIEGGVGGAKCVFKASGRTLVFDGFYKASGVPNTEGEQILPALSEGQGMGVFAIEPMQKFTSPPPRYTEASLIKMLEAEGIGRPSTYASIIGVIQDRKYAEQLERRFYATDIGMVVTDMLIEAFPDLLDLGYTREMESKLDKVEDEHLDWVDMLRNFYGPFKKRLGEVEAITTHAKAETTPAPYACPTCGSATCYRLGKNGKFLSCTNYPTCKYAAPVDRDGKPKTIETTEVACHKCGRAMIYRVGKFGAFLGCSGYSDKSKPCDGILKVDKKGHVVAPTAPPFTPEPALGCPKCQAGMYLRPGKYGPWLGCSKFPKCRGRGDFKKLPEGEQKKLLAALEAHQKAHPSVVIKTLGGSALTGADGKALAGAMVLGQKEESAAVAVIGDE